MRLGREAELSKEVSQSTQKGFKTFDPSFDYGHLPTLIGFHLRSAYLSYSRTFSEAISDRSITPLRYSVLEVVEANPGLQQVQLAAILGLSNPAATLVIDYWQARNSMTRRRSATDGRHHAVEVTEQGRRLLAQLRQKVARHDANLTVSLSQEELTQLYSSLKKIIGHKATPLNRQDRSGVRIP